MTQIFQIFVAFPISSPYFSHTFFPICFPDHIALFFPYVSHSFHTLPYLYHIYLYVFHTLPYVSHIFCWFQPRSAGDQPTDPSASSKRGKRLWSVRELAKAEKMGTTCCAIVMLNLWVMTVFHIRFYILYFKYCYPHFLMTYYYDIINIYDQFYPIIYVI